MWSLERRLLGDRDVRTTIKSGPLRGRPFVLNRARDTRMWLGVFERKLFREVADVLRPEWMVWDIGAQFGYYTLLFALRCREVVAIEPEPANALHLRRNLELNGTSATVREVAVADVDGQGLLRVDDVSYYHRLATEGDGIPVALVSVDTLLREHGPPDLVKVDIEGGEGRMLDGGEALLAERPAFVVEAHSAELARRWTDRLVDLDYAISAHGWRLLAIPG